MSPAIHVRPKVGVLSAVVAALLLAGLVPLVQAEGFKKDPVPKELNSFPKVMATPQGRDVVSLISGTHPQGLAGNEPMFVSFFNDVFFPLWTQPENAVGMDSPGKYGLAKLHDSFKKRMLMDSANRNQMGVHEVLNKVTLKKMADIVNDNYHPAVRYEAMLMIGDLHEVEPKGRSAGTLLPAALPYLLAGARKQDFPYEVRVAALVGVQRHASGTPAGPSGSKKRQEIAEAMKAVLAEKTPPEGRTQDQQDWLRQMAADIMTTMREQIPDDLKIQPKAVASAETPAAAAQ